MSLVEDLERLARLNEAGAISPSEFEAAKATLLRPGAASTPSAAPAAPQQRTPAPKPARTSGVTLKGLFRATLFLAGVAGALFLWLRQEVGQNAATTVVRALVHAPMVLREEVQSIPAASWKALPVRLPYQGTLRVDVTVLSGNDLDVYLVDEENWKRIEASAGEFKHFPNFVATKTRKVQRSGMLDTGTYYIAIHDGTLGILSASSSDVRVHVKLD